LYNTALSLLNEQGRIIWQTFAAFLVAHGFVLSALLREVGSSATPSQGSSKTVVFIAAFFGLALCIPWAAALSRSLAFYRLRSAQLRAVEPPKWDLFGGKGQTFAEGGTVAVDEQDLNGTHRLPFLARLLRTGTTMWLLLAIFMCGYLLVAWASRPWA
jgi:hypothetical protein